MNLYQETALVLKDAANRIRPPGTWTQGRFAIDCEGHSCSEMDPSAARFCLIGSLHRTLRDKWGDGAGGFIANGYKINEVARLLLYEAIADYDEDFVTAGETNSSIVDWNDDNCREQKEVVLVLDCAAKLAEEKAKSD